MRSEFKNTEEKEIKFPCLMIYNNKDKTGKYVVLFSDYATGTVVYTENNLRTLGEYCRTWATESFNPIFGEIILKN